MNAARTSTLLAFALAALSISCTTADVTRIGRAYPSKGAGCHVDVFPATKPPYPYEDIANGRAGCSFRSGCIERLQAEACDVGADAIYAFEEGIAQNSTFISATFVRKTGDAPEDAGNESPAPSHKKPSCSPPCSPGFSCEDGTCEPQCNPACAADEICTQKRVCKPSP
ncbi:MAG TPA: hypothetical protein VHJ20_18720 [Polyangia bacterium]|nr:hypothetical protein [Polyangia bacterium]